MIDFHTYPVIVKEILQYDELTLNNIKEVFGLKSGLQPMETFLLQMDAAGIDKCVILPIDCTTSRGCKIFSNEQIAQLCKKSDRVYRICQASIPTAVRRRMI